MEWMPKCSFWFWTTPSTGNWAHRWTRFHQWPQGADGVTRLNLGRKGDRGNIGWASDVHSESHPTEELWNSRKKKGSQQCSAISFCTFLSIQLIFSSWCFVYVVQFKSEKKNHNPWENRGKIKWFKLTSCPFESKKIVSLRYYVSLNGWECFELLHECVCVCVRLWNWRLSVWVFLGFDFFSSPALLLLYFLPVLRVVVPAREFRVCRHDSPRGKILRQKPHCNARTNPSSKSSDSVIDHWIYYVYQFCPFMNFCVFSHLERSYTTVWEIEIFLESCYTTHEPIDLPSCSWPFKSKMLSPTKHLFKQSKLLALGRH